MKSTAEQLRSYVTGRLLVTKVAGLLILLTTLALLGSEPSDLEAFASSALFLVLAIFQFRIWDDLADREHDRKFHPERVLPNLKNPVAFVALATILGISAGLVLLATRLASQLGLFILLNIFAAAFYASASGEHRTSRTFAVLLKYPVFVLAAVQSSIPLSAWPLACFAYFFLLIFDFLPEYLAIAPASTTPPEEGDFETVCCYSCGSDTSTLFIEAEDDLTGKPGRFSFVTCKECELRYQNPRLSLEKIKEYYDGDYIAHRRRKNWGIFTPLFEKAMGKLDRSKLSLVGQYINLSPNSKVLDVGCGAGTFLEMLRKRFGCACAGTDFKDLSGLPAFQNVTFHLGTLPEIELPESNFDLITMWHFLEHDYSPVDSLRRARKLLRPDGVLLIEVPRLDSLSFSVFGDRWPGLQAPQHTALYTERSLHSLLRGNGWRVLDSLPYGAFPAYFYFFAGSSFRILAGRGLDTAKALLPYFVFQILSAPLFFFERKLNMAMLTVIAVPDRASGEMDLEAVQVNS